jgi:hypothetical protein
MTAWTVIVAERMGFKRTEALSIGTCGKSDVIVIYRISMAASAYTTMNAISKGISIGIYEKGKDQNMEATLGGAQPYVDLMGRRFALASLSGSKGTYCFAECTRGWPTIRKYRVDDFF